MAFHISHARGFRLFYRSLLVFLVSTFISLLLLNGRIPTDYTEMPYHQLSDNITFELHAIKHSNTGGSRDRAIQHIHILLNFPNVENTLVGGNEFSPNVVPLLTILKKIQPLCPITSNKLVGWTNISAEAILKEKNDLVNYKMIQSGVTAGGRYEPSECRARHKIAIVVPVRNRRQHLTIFLRYMHPFLQRQQLNYAIIVVEQSRGSPFNRGMLLNIGFKEALLQDQEFQCFFFHDVDLLPEHDGNPYTCPEDGQPRLMTFSIDNWDNYMPTPDWHFGGVTALSTGDFRKINGFSNVFWGWGGEDNDMLQRIEMKNMTATRTLEEYPTLVRMGWSRYKTLLHPKAAPSPQRIRLLQEGPKRIATDGLTDLKYKRIDLQLKLLYTHVYVDIQQRPDINRTLT